jgi:hypothetical protein
LKLDDCLFGNCQLTLDDFIHGVRHEPRTRRLIRMATGIGAVACVSGFLLMSSPAYPSGLLLLGLGVMCFAAHNAPEQIAQRWFAKTPSQARGIRYTLNPQGLIVTSEVSQRLYAWPELQGFHELPEALLVWVSGELFLIIPKRAFSAEDLPAVIVKLEARVGAPPALPLFWSWLLLAVALAVGALTLWNRLDPR